MTAPIERLELASEEQHRDLYDLISDVASDSLDQLEAVEIPEQEQVA